MSEPSNQLIYEVLKQLQTGQAELKAAQDETNRKIGAMAENVNYIRQDIHKLRSDVQIIALAVDEHTHRLNALEGKPPFHT